MNLYFSAIKVKKMNSSFQETKEKLIQENSYIHGSLFNMLLSN